MNISRSTKTLESKLNSSKKKSACAPPPPPPKEIGGGRVRHFGTRARLQRVLRRHGDVSVVRVRIGLCPLRGAGHGRDRSDRGGCPGDHHVRRDCRPFFFLRLQGVIIRQSSAPASRARVRSTREPDRKTKGSLRARVAPRIVRFPDARAASNRQPLVSRRRGKKASPLF